MTKNAERREKFRKIGAALSRIDANKPTPFAPHYDMKPKAVNDPELSSRMFGPQFKVVQFEPTWGMRSRD